MREGEECLEGKVGAKDNKIPDNEDEITTDLDAIATLGNSKTNVDTVDPDIVLINTMDRNINYNSVTKLLTEDVNNCTNAEDEIYVREEQDLAADLNFITRDTKPRVCMSSPAWNTTLTETWTPRHSL